MIDFRDIDICLEAIRNSYAWGEPIDLAHTPRRAEILMQLCSVNNEEFEVGAPIPSEPSAVGAHSYYGPPSIMKPVKFGVGDHVQLSPEDAWHIRLVRSAE